MISSFPAGVLPCMLASLNFGHKKGRSEDQPLRRALNSDFGNLHPIFA
jgi:hypothetical protein